MKKDSMMDKKQEEPTPDSQRVTWGNRVATVLMIGIPWLAARLLAELSHQGTSKGFLLMGVTFGAYAATTGFFIALFAKNKVTQRWLRCFAWLVTLPLTFILIGLIEVKLIDDASTSKILIVQFSVLFLMQGLFFFMKARKKNGN